MTETFDNLYDPANVAHASETQPFDVVVQNAINAALLDLHVALPASVIAVEPGGGVAVQPLLKRIYRSGSVVNLPPIQGVPVWSPRGASYFVQLPVAPGDLGLVIFSERSLDKWKSGDGSAVETGDVRTHDLSDAVFFPGLYPFTLPAEALNAPSDPTALVLHNGLSEFWLTKTGQFRLGNSALPTGDLLQLLQQLVTVLDAMNVASVTPPVPLVTPADVLAWANKIQAAAVLATPTLATITTALATLVATP